MPELVTCVPGARVMYLKNDSLSQGISNGTYGNVLGVDEEGTSDVVFSLKDELKVRGKIIDEYMVDWHTAFENLFSHESFLDQRHIAVAEHSYRYRMLLR